MDPSQEQEATPPEEIVSQSSESSSTQELSEALDLARTFGTIRRDASSSGQEIGENLDSVLHRDLSQRLNSLVLVLTRKRVGDNKKTYSITSHIHTIYIT